MQSVNSYLKSVNESKTKGRGREYLVVDKNTQQLSVSSTSKSKMKKNVQGLEKKYNELKDFLASRNLHPNERKLVIKLLSSFSENVSKLNDSYLQGRWKFLKRYFPNIVKTIKPSETEKNLLKLKKDVQMFTRDYIKSNLNFKEMSEIELIDVYNKAFDNDSLSPSLNQVFETLEFLEKLHNEMAGRDQSPALKKFQTKIQEKIEQEKNNLQSLVNKADLYEISDLEEKDLEEIKKELRKEVGKSYTILPYEKALTSLNQITKKLDIIKALAGKKKADALNELYGKATQFRTFLNDKIQNFNQSEA